MSHDYMIFGGSALIARVRPYLRRDAINTSQNPSSSPWFRWWYNMNTDHLINLLTRHHELPLYIHIALEAMPHVVRCFACSKRWCFRLQLLVITRGYIHFGWWPDDPTANPSNKSCTRWFALWNHHVCTMTPQKIPGYTQNCQFGCCKPGQWYTKSCEAYEII